VNDLKLLFFKLRRLLRSRGNSVADTDDLIQEAFLRLQLYCREHKVEKAEPFLVRVALNLSSDLHRHRKRSGSVAETVKTLQVAEAGPSADEVFAAQERLLRMKAGLDRMSPRRREVFILNRIEGYTFPQIAKQLNITLSAVEKHVAKALLFMTDWMDEENQDVEGPGK